MEIGIHITATGLGIVGHVRNQHSLWSFSVFPNGAALIELGEIGSVVLSVDSCGAVRVRVSGVEFTLATGSRLYFAPPWNAARVTHRVGDKPRLESYDDECECDED